MRRKTFRGGVHPDEKKELARDVPFRHVLTKETMVYPLSQHIGRPATAVVKKGDKVLAGQLIGEASGFVSANIISSCSGKVKAVEKRRTVMGTMVDAVIIDNDGEYTEVPGIGEKVDFRALSKDEILKKIKDAGIVGLGGAGFPTHVKLAPKNADGIRYVIANGAECEPYISCDDQLMRTESDTIVRGMQVILCLFPQAEGVIVIEKNKPEAIAAMQEAVARLSENGGAAAERGSEGAAGTDASNGASGQIRVLPVPVKYPQGGEREIISVVAGIDIKASQLPADAGCIVDNVATVYAIERAVCESTPLMEKGVTISGEGVAHPSNFITRIGTPVSALFEEAGGLKEGAEVKKILCGGPMMGIAMSDLDVPFQKSNNAFTFLTVDDVEDAEQYQTTCIRCSRCVRVCPLGLNPQLMSVAAEEKDYERYEKKLYGLECISCGCCTYTCPAKRPLMQLFKVARTDILTARAVARAEAAAKKAEEERKAKEARQAEIDKAVEAAMRANAVDLGLARASEAEKAEAAKAEADAALAKTKAAKAKAQAAAKAAAATKAAAKSKDTAAKAKESAKTAAKAETVKTEKNDAVASAKTAAEKTEPTAAKADTAAPAKPATKKAEPAAPEKTEATKSGKEEQS